MEKRWAKFQPTDTDIGVARDIVDPSMYHVPHTYHDRMNAVAFYVTMTGNDSGYTTTQHGYKLPVAAFETIRDWVHIYTGPPPEPRYASLC